MSARPLQLEFVAPDPGAYFAPLERLMAAGAKRIRVSPDNELSRRFRELASASGRGAALHSGQDGTAGDGDAIFLFHTSGPELARALLACVDLPGGAVVAPVGDAHFSKRALFILSIPKSGTHLLYELANAFGYSFAGSAPDDARPGSWYFVDAMNSHTPTSFLRFEESSYNLYHPLLKSPALFIYRNPLDVVVSEANYYHEDGRSAFWSYLSERSFEERLLKLIDDPWLLGSIRERMGRYIGWMDLQNVIPLSFEELIGPNGGGTLADQTALIWSLQLKLQVPGEPAQLGNKVFNENSATFHAGQIGSYRKHFTEAAYRKFLSLPQDFMEAMGYSCQATAADAMPRRAAEFRRRPLKLSELDAADTPIGHEFNYLQHNIVRYRGSFYAVPQRKGRVDLANLPARDLAGLQSHPELATLKARIVAQETVERLPRHFWRALGRLWERLLR